MRTIQEMVTSIGEVIREKKMKEAQNSLYFSLLCDETTDVAVLKQLIIYARYVAPDKQVRVLWSSIMYAQRGVQPVEYAPTLPKS